MCKGNTIEISWSWIGAIASILMIGGGIIATMLGAHLTWGEIIILPFLVTFFLNRKHRYRFTDSGFTMQWMIRKRIISAEQIKQIDVLTTKSGTWIIIELHDAPPLPSQASRAALFYYSVRHRKESFLLPLQWGERDQALDIIRVCCPEKIKIAGV